MYKQTTHGVSVSVMPVYIDERSDPEQGFHFWAYRVTIENRSNKTIQLKSRYWRITDSTGQVEEVRGEGVVGEQPVLEPDTSYTYSSGCPLRADSGIMEGSYFMEDVDGNGLEIAIPAFPLDLPDANPVMN